MADVLVRNLEEKTHRELKRRAKRNGHSLNAEIVALLNKLAEAGNNVGLGTQIEEWKKQYLNNLEGGLNGDSNFTFEVIRDTTPARYVDFSSPEFGGLDKE